MLGFVKCKLIEISYVADLKSLLVEVRIDFNGLSKKNMPENLRFKVVEENGTSRENRLTLIHAKENIKLVYLEKISSDSFVLIL